MAHMQTVSGEAAGFDMVVFSHLRWEFVTQRPQHLISRIGRGRKVLYVEEPIDFTPENRGTANVIVPAPGITIIQSRIAHWDMEALAEVVNGFTEELQVKDPVAWFYSPMFVEVLAGIGHSAVVYDCMDELSAFKGASALMKENEKRLFAAADIVFTGGKSLYEARKDTHGNIHCFPSSIERGHFEKAQDEGLAVPRDIASAKHPVVGYYGVIDERMDLDLIRELSRLMPEASFAMIGPVVKIDEKDLPRAENIHYLGGKKYEELPAYLKAIDIAFMPFALNESTKFISPTKTLEFMAAGKPIVSTPITDVVRDYAAIVKIGGSADEFKAAIEAFLGESQEGRKERVEAYERILGATSWDKTAQAMKKIISDKLSKHTS